MASIYSFADYSPDWPVEFNREAERIRLLLTDELIEVHHIGSTSVPGRAAKPIIDLLAVVRDICRIDELSPLLEEAGYKAWGEYGLLGRRLFTKDRNSYRTHNVHIYPAGHPDIDRHLAFRAFLRSNDEVRNEYEALKRDVYSRYPSDIAAYNDGKDSWIKRIEPVALEWFRLTRLGKHEQFNRIVAMVSVRGTVLDWECQWAAAMVNWPYGRSEFRTLEKNDGRELHGCCPAGRPVVDRLGRGGSWRQLAGPYSGGTPG
jgi:GrpB-like predicted nucleotidyltransferase (UPF0157 family)